MEEKSLIEIKDDQIAELVKYCDEEYLENFKLTDQEIQQLKKDLKKKVLSQGFSVPMLCRGPLCIVADTCPLVAMGKPPISKKCPLESLLMNKWKDEYISSLQIDWNDKVERILASELIEIDILNARANTVLADEGFIMENAIGVNEQTGEPIINKQKHIALELKEMMYNRRSKVLKEMLATREAKAKFIQDLKGDPAQYAADLRKKFAQITKDHEGDIIIDASDVEEEKDEVKEE